MKNYRYNMAHYAQEEMTMRTFIASLVLFMSAFSFADDRFTLNEAATPWTITLQPGGTVDAFYRANKARLPEIYQREWIAEERTTGYAKFLDDMLVADPVLEQRSDFRSMRVGMPYVLPGAPAVVVAEAVDVLIEPVAATTPATETELAELKVISARLDEQRALLQQFTARLEEADRTTADLESVSQAILHIESSLGASEGADDSVDVVSALEAHSTALYERLSASLEASEQRMHQALIAVMCVSGIFLLLALIVLLMVRSKLQERTARSKLDQYWGGRFEELTERYFIVRLDGVLTALPYASENHLDVLEISGDPPAVKRRSIREVIKGVPTHEVISKPPQLQ